MSRGHRRIRLVAVPAVLLGGCLGRTQAPVPLRADAPKSALATPVLSSKRTPQGIELELAGGKLAISAPRADTFRVHLARQGARELPSFAVDEAALSSPAALQIEESDGLVLLRTDKALLRIDKQPLRLRLMDQAGHVVSDPALQVDWQGAGVRLLLGMNEHERVFGLGDKVRGFDRRGQSFELWNTDSFGWKVDADPLYKSLPFWLYLEGGHARGVFVDQPGRATVDFGKEQPNLVSYEAKQAEAFDVYLFASQEPKRVLEAYTALTGRTPLPPRWTLGYHQSRYGYKSEAEVRSVIARLQKEKFPVDAVWLDIDYQAGNAPFTVDTKAFPTFGKMVADLKQSGVHTIAITDLHIKSYQHPPAGQASPGYAPYDTGAAGDHFIHAKNGFFEGPVWPGPSVFPEFTRESTRKWWGGLYRGFVEQGVAGFWNDMNEPALFVKDKTFPEDVMHRLDDGSTLPHAQVHNVYGMLNARATFEGARALRPDVRPFVLTRAAYAGAQKYAASWTGDNTADRSHLAVTIPQLLNLGVSGYPFNGADVGGFVGCPDAELFADWMELGALQPFYRNHSAKEGCRREPWLFGAAIEARARKAVERRYRLLPYLYTVFEEATRSGLPIMRPLWLEYPQDAATYTVDSAYLLGADLLVAAKLAPGGARYRVTLPVADWYDTETLALVEGGPREIEPVGGSSVRLFARAGAIIPEAPVAENTSATLAGSLTLTVWPGQDCRGALYLDDGESFAFQSGKSRRIAYTCDKSDAAIHVSARSNGDYPVWWQDSVLVLHEVPRPPSQVALADGKALPHAYDAAKKTLTVNVPGRLGDFELNVGW